MGNISIFAKQGYLGNFYPNIVKGNTILRLSGETRGKQVADYIGAKFNPIEGFENDLCISVKGYRLNDLKDGDYVDFSDMSFEKLAPLLRKEINVIAHSQYAYNYLKQRLPNKMVCIPQQHINWENAGRMKNKAIIGGYIGRPSNISNQIQSEVKQALKGIGVDFKVCFKWETREDAINFYKSIDFLVIGGYGLLPDDLWQITPNKMINAASFGVPSLSFMRVGYQEWEGNYTQFKTMDDLITEVEKLKDEVYYNYLSKIIKEKAKAYHISKIGELYKGLQ
jgi:hypothetical protein